MTLHLDFYTQKGYISGALVSIFDRLLDKNKDVEVLIIAGDVSHYNTDISIIEQIGKDYNYKKIFMVIGNHDLYLTSNNQKNKYHRDSKNREQEWYDYKDPEGVVNILNGDIIEYKGVKFGGCMGWYDMSYNTNSMYGTDNITLWNQTMNDSRLIYKMGDPYDIFAQERPKIESILKADVIITHISPLCSGIAFQEQYRGQKSNMFYCFDGREYLDQTDAKYYIYGHSHGHFEYEAYGVKCIMNALGYPNERTNVKKTIIEI